MWIHVKILTDIVYLPDMPDKQGFGDLLGTVRELRPITQGQLPLLVLVRIQQCTEEIIQLLQKVKEQWRQKIFFTGTDTQWNRRTVGFGDLLEAVRELKHLRVELLKEILQCTEKKIKLLQKEQWRQKIFFTGTDTQWNRRTVKTNEHRTLHKEENHKRAYNSRFGNFVGHGGQVDIIPKGKSSKSTQTDSFSDIREENVPKLCTKQRHCLKAALNLPTIISCYECSQAQDVHARTNTEQHFNVQQPDCGSEEFKPNEGKMDLDRELHDEHEQLPKPRGKLIFVMITSSKIETLNTDVPLTSLPYVSLSKKRHSLQLSYFQSLKVEKPRELQNLMKSNISFRISICSIVDFIRNSETKPDNAKPLKGKELCELVWNGNIVTLNERDRNQQTFEEWFSKINFSGPLKKPKEPYVEKCPKDVEGEFDLPLPANQIAKKESKKCMKGGSLKKQKLNHIGKTSESKDVKCESVDIPVKKSNESCKAIKKQQVKEDQSSKLTVDSELKTPLVQFSASEVNGAIASAKSVTADDAQGIKVQNKDDIDGDQALPSRSPLEDITREILPGPKLVGTEVQAFFGFIGATKQPFQYQLSEKFSSLSSVVAQIAQGIKLKPQITMRYEALRLCTLRTYPRENKPFITRLASAGFYYASDEDGVVCYCCGIRRYGWNRTENPMEVHTRINPSCKFLRRNAEFNVPMTFIGPMRRNVAALENIPDCKFEKDYGEDVNNDEETPQPAPPKPQNSYGIALALPKHPDYAPRIVRENSYTGWPNTSVHTPKELAEAGFYYAGFGDCVRCFFCGIGLRHWDQDDNVWIEHARWSRKCVFLKQKKGEEFINLVQLAVQYSAEIEEQRENGLTGDIPTRELEKYLISDAAQAALEDGHTPLQIKQALERILTNNPSERITAALLVSTINSITEETAARTQSQQNTSSSTSQSLSTSTPAGQSSSSNPLSSMSSIESTNSMSASGAGNIPAPAPAQSLPLSCAAEAKRETTGGASTGMSNVMVSQHKKAGDPSETTVNAAGSNSSPSSNSSQPVTADNVKKSINTTGKDAHAIMAENQMLKEQAVCKICLDSPVCIVFLPCGHLVTCADCAPAMRKCPICRAVVKGTVRTYMA